LYSSLALNPISFIDLTGESPEKPPNTGDVTGESPKKPPNTRPVRRFLGELAIVIATILSGGTTDTGVPKLAKPPLANKEILERDEKLRQERESKNKENKRGSGSARFGLLLDLAVSAVIGLIVAGAEGAQGAAKDAAIMGAAAYVVARAVGPKAVPYLGIAMAKDEGEAGAAVLAVAACASIPGANLVCGAVALGAIAGAIGYALYERWKGPAIIMPKLEFPPTEERIGPATGVAYESLPSPEPGPPAPNTLKMRPESNPSEKPPKVRHFGITKSLNEGGWW
jgi:hypothetical protein